MPANDERRAVDDLLQRAAAAGVPAAGAFELTSRCNLACRMCYVRHGLGDAEVEARELPAHQWVALIEEATQAGLLFVLLTGGEVLIRPDFLEIYAPLTELGLHLTIYSNGTLVTPAIARGLAKRPPHRVAVTLYGASPETYAAVTGSGDAFSRALRGIDQLLEVGISVAVRTTLTRQNVHDHEAVRELAHARGLPLTSAWLLSCRPDGAPSRAPEDRLSPAEIVALEAADRECRESWQATLPSADPQRGAMYCQAGRSAFVVGPSGEMNPCLDLPLAAARPLEVGFPAAWERVRQFTERVPRMARCQDCSVSAYCGTCPATPYVETGSFQGAIPYHCEIAHERARVFGRCVPSGEPT
jgi:radical SAM protein with 4Fe4S-binding SPASM domain